MRDVQIRSVLRVVSNHGGLDNEPIRSILSSHNKILMIGEKIGMKDIPESDAETERCLDIFDFCLAGSREVCNQQQQLFWHTLP